MGSVERITFMQPLYLMQAKLGEFKSLDRFAGLWYMRPILG